MLRTKKQRLGLFSKVDIYPVISSEFTLGRPPIDILKKIADGDAKIVQLREKHLPDAALYKLAVEYKKICDKYNMLLIINDRIDIALSVNADGVHLGQEDFPLRAAGKLAPELIIGVSTHSKEEALKAQKEGADYINIGPIYATQTKNTVLAPLGESIITEISSLLTIPFTVMGGIKEKHIPRLIKLNASKIAMITELTMAEDVKEKIMILRSYFNHGAS